MIWSYIYFAFQPPNIVVFFKNKGCPTPNGRIPFIFSVRFLRNRDSIARCSRTVKLDFEHIRGAGMCEMKAYVWFILSPTVDGRNPAPVDMENIPFLIISFHTSQVVQDFFHLPFGSATERKLRIWNLVVFLVLINNLKQIRTIHTVDGWNPKQPPGMVLKPYK